MSATLRQLYMEPQNTGVGRAGEPHKKGIKVVRNLI